MKTTKSINKELRIKFMKDFFASPMAADIYCKKGLIDLKRIAEQLWDFTNSEKSEENS